jgi:hypothetical protein
VLRDEEPLGDLVGPEMVVEEEQHFELAGRQRLGDRVGDAALGGAFAHLLEQPARDGARECGLAFGHALEELDDALRRLGLEQIAGGTAADRGQQVLLGAGCGEDDDLAVGRCLAQARERGQAVELGHREVEQHEVGLEAARGVDRLEAVAGLPDHVEAALLEQLRQRVARQRVIVDYEDSRHSRLIGKTLPAD